MERTLIVLKPDAVARGLIGEILSRFERVGLKVIAAELVRVPEDLAHQHYPANREAFVRGMGQKTLDDYKSKGIDPKKEFGTDDPVKIGEMVRGWLTEMIMSGPVFAAVLEGPNAVAIVRKMVGHTLPSEAIPGTIRGDYSHDSPDQANAAKRPVKNLIHASGNLEEAKYEIDLWFEPHEIQSYKRVEEEVMR